MKTTIDTTTQASVLSANPGETQSAMVTTAATATTGVPSASPTEPLSATVPSAKVKPTPPAPNLVSAAYHVAGHAVIGNILAVNPDIIRVIHANAGDTPLLHVLSKKHMLQYPPFYLRNCVLRLMVTLAAGVAAEKRRSTRLNMDELWAGHGAWDWDAMMRTVIYARGGLPYQVAIKDEAIAIAQVLVSKNWPQIKRAADDLVKKHILLVNVSVDAMYEPLPRKETLRRYGADDIAAFQKRTP